MRFFLKRRKSYQCDYFIDIICVNLCCDVMSIEINSEGNVFQICLKRSTRRREFSVELEHTQGRLCVEIERRSFNGTF